MDVPGSGVIVVGVLERRLIVVPYIYSALDMNVVCLREIIGEVKPVTLEAWFRCGMHGMTVDFISCGFVLRSVI